MEPGVVVFSCSAFGTSDAVFSVVLITSVGLAISLITLRDAWLDIQEKEA